MARVAAPRRAPEHAVPRDQEPATEAATEVHARRAIEADEPVTPHPKLDKLIGTHVGTKTLVLDAVAAQRLLATNSGNRRVSPRRVSLLAQQMRDGHWENTGEPIIVSDEGILNNGQHRLMAIVEADAAVEMDVRFGIPRKAFVKTDTGAARSSGDVLSIRGVSGGPAIAMALRLLILYERGLPEHLRDTLTNDAVNRAFDRWPEIEDAYNKVQVFRFPPQIRSTPLYATAFLALRGQKAAKVEAWLHTLATGEEAAREDPAYALRERLLRTPLTEVGTRERQLTRFALMIKSWNAFRSGEGLAMRDLRWSASGRLSEPFPQVQGAKLS